MALDYFRVTWEATHATVDRGDDDPHPDFTPVAGYVTFKPSREVTYDLANPPRTIIIENVRAGIDDAGKLRNGDGDLFVELISPWSADLSHQGWTWEAHFDLNDAPVVGPFPFLPNEDNDDVDLSLDAPVYLSRGIAIVRGPHGPAGPTGPTGPAGANGSGAVNSVNGKVGSVVLTSSDVGAQPAGNYVTSSQLNSALLPVARKTDLARVATTGDYDDLLNKPVGDGSGNGTIISVNGDQGPEVSIGLADLEDVNIPRETQDDQGSIVTPGPPDGALLEYDSNAGRWVAGISSLPPLSQLDNRYAPANYRPPYYVPIYVGATGTVPADFPNGGLFYNTTTSTWSVYAAATLKPPVAPTGLAVVSGSITSTSLGLSWNAVTTTTPTGGPAVTSYAVFQNGIQVKTVAGIGTTMTGLTASTAYSFRVAAINSDGTGAQSTAVTGTTLPATGTAPGAPSNLRTTATAGQTSVALAWDAGTAGSTATQGYRVYRNGTTLMQTFTGLSGTLTGLVAGTTYSLTVKAFNSVGESAASNTLSVTTASAPTGTAPGAPGSLAAGTPGPNSVALTWTASSAGTGGATQGYRAYSGTTLLQTFGATATSGTLTGLNPATAYTLTLKAFNPIGESTASNSVSITTANAPTGTFTPRFRVGNYYETPLPSNAPIHPRNTEYLADMAKGQFIRLVGGSNDSTSNVFWPGSYVAKSTDPLYHIDLSGGVGLSALGAGGHGVRIPAVAKQYYALSGAANDSPMKIYSPPGVSGSRGFYMWAAMLQWQAGGTPVGSDTDRTGKWLLQGTGAAAWLDYTDTYGHSADNLKSGTVWPSRLRTLSGVGTGVAPSFYQDEPLNGGFRGCNKMIRCIDYDRTVAEGRVNHVSELFIGTVETAPQGRWPMTGFESKGGLIPEGIRMRIKPSIDVEARLRAQAWTAGNAAGLAQAIAIAKGWQDFGFMIADNSGSANHRIKLANTAKEGRGNLWKLPNDGLSTFKFPADWETIAEDFDASGRTP